MDKWVIYGMIEPETRKIVYIDFYIDNENYIYKEDKVFLDNAIKNMQDTENPYWRDLVNMYENKLIEVVVLEVLDNEYEAKEAMDRYIKWFKPRYNYNNILYNYNNILNESFDLISV